MNRSNHASLASASPFGRLLVALTLLMGMVGLLTGCGASSRSISIVGPALPELVSITITPSASTLATGVTRQFTATGAYSDGTNANISSSVTWTSKVPSVATISNAAGSAGVVTAISVGGTTITASLGGITGSTTLTVTGSALVSIAVTPAAQTVPKNTPLQYTATGIYSNNTTQNLTALVTWASTNSSVATISNAAGSLGLATTIAAGTTTITATLGAQSGSTPLTVTNATLTSITITPANSTITGGSTEQLTATGNYSDNSTQNLTDYVAWSSSNASLATVSNAKGSQGLATAISQGGVTVTASFSGISGTTGLTIATVALQSITITPAAASVVAGSTQQFTATGNYNNGSTQNITTLVTWTSSNTTVATISAQGFANAVAAGQTSITATLSGITASVPFTVTNGVLKSIAITPTAVILNIGQSQQFVATGTYADGVAAPLPNPVTWTSSAPTVASIGATGIATGLKLGTTTITASVTTSAGTVTSNVANVTVVEIAYVLNFNDRSAQPPAAGSITEYQIFPTGQLTPVATIATGVAPFNLAIDPTNTHAYVANYDNGVGGSIGEFTIAPSGLLASSGTAPTDVGPNSIAINPTGAFAYVANEGSGTPDIGFIDEYSIAGGVLNNAYTQLPVTSLSTGASEAPISIALNPAGTGTNTTPAGSFAYVAAGLGAGVVNVYQIQNGLLVSPPIQTIACGNAPNEIVIDPFDRFAYVVNNTDGSVSEYSINPTTGTLTAIGTVAADPSDESLSITLDSQGQNAYVTNYRAGTVWQYSINQTTGALTFVTSTPAGSSPSWLAIDPSGQFAYVTDRTTTGSTIEQFSITNGALVPIGPVPSTGTQPVAIFTAP